MHVLELEDWIEHDLREIVLANVRLDWKEEVISHELAKKLRQRLDNTTLYGVRYPLNIRCEIYKLDGKPETAHGDFGLLFRYQLPTGKLIEGAGFMEAKLRGRNTTKFLQVRGKQVQNILARSPQTRLLLYDYNPVPVLDADSGTGDDFETSHHCYRHHGFAYARVSHGPVLPLQLAAEVNRYDDTLYRFCHSLAHQFTRRYFHLHDLDFGEAAINAVKGFPSTKAIKGFSGNVGSPNIIMVVRAAPQGQELPMGFTPNDNLYSSIE